MTGHFGYIAAIFAVVGYAALGPIAKKIAVPPSQYYLFISISAGVLACGAAIGHYLSNRGQVLPSLSSAQWGGLVLFSLVNLIAYRFYLLAVCSIPVAQYDMIAGAGIVLSALFAAALLGEPIHPRYFAAILLILVGIWIAVGPDVRGVT